MKKEQTPENVDKSVAFLASHDPHNLTGQAINPDDGRRRN
jgi:NAD(P)-dependent dehydrogenase (short-subunit alcohol dehydrogenase family)